MPIKVHLPDGRVVNFPDGMPPEQIQAEVAKLAGPSPTAPQAESARGWGDTITNALPTIGGAIGGIVGGMPGAAAGGAAGTGLRELAENASQIPGAMRDVASNLMSNPRATMGGFLRGAFGGARDAAVEGGMQAGAEGGGRLISAGLMRAAKPLYNFGLGASKALRREYPNLAETGLKEGIAVSGRGTQKAERLMSASSQKVDETLAARDATMPKVRGYLPAATEAVPLGRAPKPSGGRASVEPAAMTQPRKVGPVGNVEEIQQRRWTPVFGGTARGGADATGDVVAGAGTVRRPINAAPGRGAPPTMIDPREIAQALAGPRGDLASRALGADDVAQLGQLESQFLTQQTRPLTLTQANAMKRAEQKIADASFRSAEAGHPVNAVEAQFHKALATGARQAIERKAPEVAAMNQRTQALGGLRTALEDAETRNHIMSRLLFPAATGVSTGMLSGDASTGFGSAALTAGLTAPGNLSRGAIGAYKFGQANIPAHLIRAAILAQLEQD